MGLTYFSWQVEYTSTSDLIELLFDTPLNPALRDWANDFYKNCFSQFLSALGFLEQDSVRGCEGT